MPMRGPILRRSPRRVVGAQSVVVTASAGALFSIFAATAAPALGSIPPSSWDQPW
jgi:hypothetical protein